MPQRDLLAAVPVAASGTTLVPLHGGGAVLTRRAPQSPGLGGWLAKRLRLRRELRFELDELGVCYWTQIDGERRLSEIQSTLSAKYELTPEAARRAVVEFTATLMRRNLLGLRMERP
jgi:hypothetical protein